MEGIKRKTLLWLKVLRRLKWIIKEVTTKADPEHAVHFQLDVRPVHGAPLSTGASRMLILDVEVVDDNLLRIAGTGPYSSNLGHPMTTGTNAFKSVISTRRHKVIERSGQDP